MQLLYQLMDARFQSAGRIDQSKECAKAEYESDDIAGIMEACDRCH